jgi:pimeloyl-ACP methyl ester carboxylesterase
VPRRIVLCLPDGAVASDPNAAETAKRDIEIAYGWDGTPAGVVGFAEGGFGAFRLAFENPELVDRLVLVSTPIPEHDGGAKTVSAKTLLLYGSKDPAGGQAQANWWQNRLVARIEMVPGEGRDILERVWPRALSFLAPRSLRK